MAKGLPQENLRTVHATKQRWYEIKQKIAQVMPLPAEMCHVVDSRRLWSLEDVVKLMQLFKKWGTHNAWESTEVRQLFPGKTACAMQTWYMKTMRDILKVTPEDRVQALADDSRSQNRKRRTPPGPTTIDGGVGVVVGALAEPYLKRLSPKDQRRRTLLEQRALK